MEVLRNFANFAAWKAFIIVSCFRKSILLRKSSESFANFFKKVNPLRIKNIRIMRPIKTLHLTTKKHGICEKRLSETRKSCEISMLGFKETSDL